MYIHCAAAAARGVVSSSEVRQYGYKRERAHGEDCTRQTHRKAYAPPTDGAQFLPEGLSAALTSDSTGAGEEAHGEGGTRSTR